MTWFVLGWNIINTNPCRNDPNPWVFYILIGDRQRLVLNEVSLMTSTIRPPFYLGALPSSMDSADLLWKTQVLCTILLGELVLSWRSALYLRQSSITLQFVLYLWPLFQIQSLRCPIDFIAANHQHLWSFKSMF